jgi:ferredoxin-NADP reductase
MSVVDQHDLAERGRASRLRGSLILGCAVAVATLGGVVAWWSSAPSLAGVAPGQLATSLAQLSGLVASVLICVQLLLISRVPWLVEVIGLGPMASWHRSVGSAVLILIVAHVGLVVVGGMLLDRRTLWSELIIVVAGDPEIVQALVGTGLVLAAGLTSARLARSRLRYEWWYAIHVTVYLGVFLSFGHQVHSGVHFVANQPMRIAWTVLYLLTAGVIVLGRVIIPWAGFHGHRLWVERVVPEAADVVSVWLRGHRLERLGIRPGQFFFVRFLAPGHLWTAHPYSVSLLPDQGRMRFTIGAAGDHSNRARHLKPGTRVLLEGPFGNFCAARSDFRGVLLIAGGSGIGPIAALARDLCQRGRDVVLVHRASSEQRLPLRAELTGLELSFLPVLGRRDELGHDPLRPDSLVELVPDLASREAFVCGSVGFVLATTTALHNLGVPADRIHREELELA